MSELLAVKAGGTDFPYGDISAMTASTASVMLANRDVYETIHQASELQPVMRHIHASLDMAGRTQLAASDDEALEAFSFGIGTFESLCVMTSPHFRPEFEFEHDEQGFLKESELLGAIVDAKDELLARLPNTAEAVTDIASRRYERRLEYALAGAAIMRVLLLPSQRKAS